MILMMMLLIGSLMNQALIELINHGEILQGLRWSVHGWAESLRFPLFRLLVTPLRALHCPFCISHWTSIPVSLAVVLASGLDWWWVPVLWLPITRLSNIWTDLIGDRSRSPGSGINPRLQDAGPEELEERLSELLDGKYEVVSDGKETDRSSSAE